MVRQRWMTAIVLLLVAGAMAPLAQAQSLRGIGIYEEELRARLDRRQPADRELGIDYGGWFNFAVFAFDDAGWRRERTLRQYQVRPWASVNYRNVHHAYVRGLLNWDNWASGDHPRMRSETDYDGQVERAWYRFDLDKFLQQSTGQSQPFDFSVKVGRDFTTIGTALVLSMPLDLIEFDLTAWNFRMRALLGKTFDDQPNLDWSDYVLDEQERCFWGFELTYLGLGQHRPFAYFLTNNDHSSPRWPDPFQRYDYSSRYLGVGSYGTLFIPHLTYSTELVGEWGRTFSEGAYYNRDEICAYAYDWQMQYLFDVTTKPRVEFEYLLASGDSDRRASTNSTIGGNLEDTRDTAFNAFGFRDTGISFAPRVSNLHMWKFGAKFLPFESVGCQLLKRMELGSSVFFYAKQKAEGPISDSTAQRSSQWLGWEWDVYCNWRLTSDLAWTARYGVFMPGAAYAEQFDDPRHFFYTGLTLSF